VLVGIHVIERQTGRAKSCELRADFRFELAANPRKQEKPDPGSGHVPVEYRIVANKCGNRDSRQDRTAIHQNQMQTDAKVGQSAGPRHRIGGCLAADHQARRGEDPVPMRLIDRLVD